MDLAIIGNPDRGNVSFTLAAGESVVVEADSMSLMTAGMEVKPTPRPGPASSRRSCSSPASRDNAAHPRFPRAANGGYNRRKRCGDDGVHPRKKALAGVSLGREGRPARSPLTPAAGQGYWAVP